MGLPLNLLDPRIKKFRKEGLWLKAKRLELASFKGGCFVGIPHSYNLCLNCMEDALTA